MNIRERADQYMEKHFPESDFEDLKITTDQLIDGIPQAYEDGYKDAIDIACKWLARYFMDGYYVMSPTDFEAFVLMFKEALENDNRR